MSKKKMGMILIIILVAAVGLVALFSWLIEDPLRDYLLGKVNGSLKGYEVTMRQLDFHPLELSVDLTDLRLIQQRHPSPPVVAIQTLTAGIYWKALLYGRLVADCHLEKPDIRIDLTHIRAEANDPVPLQDRGWRKVGKMPPLKINLLRVSGGKVSYLGTGNIQPLVIDDIVLGIRNIQSIHNTDKPFPSEIEMSARMFGDGKIRFGGQGSFLPSSNPGVTGELVLADIPLSGLSSVLKQSPVSIEDGSIDSVRLQMAYSDQVRKVHVSEARISGLKSNYILSKSKKALLSPSQKAVVKKKAAASAVALRVDRLLLTGAEIGFINRKTDPSYRIFIKDARLSVENYSDRFEKGPATMRLKGSFMGSGDTAVYGKFRAETKGADFDIHAAIRNTAITDMNPLLKAYADLDAAAGKFSLFSELSVHDRHIKGYVKPLFHNMELYSGKQDQNENLFQQIYEGAADALKNLLESEPRDVVATKTDLSGNLDNPKANTWEALLNLVRNAFFNSILPGFTNNISS